MSEGPAPGSRASAAAAGAVAAGVALGVGELLAGLLPGAPSPIIAIGGLVIDLQPPGAKDFVVGLFGTADKLALQLVVVTAVLVIGAGLGLLARRRFGVAAAILVGFAAVGFVAGLRDPDAISTLAAVSSAASAGAGVVSLSWLLATIGVRSPTGELPRPFDWSRRGLLVRGGALAIGSIAAGAFGRSLLEGARRTPEETALPAATAAPPPAAGAELDVDGLSPLVVPNRDFYLIDTTLIPPNVDRASWRLRVHGMVEREVELDYDELIALGPFEQYVTIACVSNLVGGDLIGNAKWTGVRLRDVLAMAGVQPTATQLVGRSVDGWTAGMPTAWVLDPAREPMIAVGMNDEPLPREHGYPARLIVPGLYGYVSATKWVTELELTTLEAFDAYWVPLGWAKEAPVLTQSRIDVPRNGANLAPGTVTIAGVAWAMDRGVGRVEVSIDGEWHDATLATPISSTTWVQWRFDWPATSGGHEIAVRATDGTGQVQTAERSRPDPDGARGHHTIRVNVA